MDYQFYIVASYGIAALLIGGLIAHTLVDARRTAKALAARAHHES